MQPASGGARRTLAGTAIALACFVIVFAVSGFFVRSVVSDAFAKSEDVRTARAAVSAVVTEQLDQETGIRGYAATGERLFLQPYASARKQQPQTLAHLQAAVDSLNMPEGSQLARDVAASAAAWQTEVAQPMLAGSRRDQLTLQTHGKALMDRFRSQTDLLDRALTARRGGVNAEMEAAIWRVGIFALAAVVATAAFAAALVFLQLRALERVARERDLQTAYATEKRIADKLQAALFLRPLPDASGLHLSATYAPAEEETKVGGDWYDVVEMPGNRVLFVIGDVAGHGIDAAVTMNKARQALVFAAMVESDPGAMLARANDELLRDRSSMVTVIAGFADYRAFELSFAIAGHPPPLLLEPGREPRLLGCGGLPLGIVAGSAYRVQRLQTVPGASLVLYTDGAIEHSHDAIEGERLLIDAALASSGNTERASAIYHAIFENRARRDDVAILSIGFPGGEARDRAVPLRDAAKPRVPAVTLPSPAHRPAPAGLRRAS